MRKEVKSNSTKTINVKDLEHGEREHLIFSNIENLKHGETLRIILEFNPVPLIYLLKAQDFEVTYEKEGPGEWILKAKKMTSEESRKEHLKELLNEMKEGQVSAATKEKVRDLFQTVDAKTLGLIEQELIREGVSHEEIRKSLCDIHLETLKDALVSKRIEAPKGHPIHTFMEEHKIIIDTLHDLASLVKRWRKETDPQKLSQELEELKEIAHHLVEAESHHQREEDVVFPRMEKHDVVEPPEIMKMDHVEFRKIKQELYKIAHNPEDYTPKEFKSKVIELGEYLTKELESHIFKEDNILYQIALQVLNPEEWTEVKRECDKIRYCCFTPEDQKK